MSSLRQAPLEAPQAPSQPRAGFLPVAYLEARHRRDRQNQQETLEEIFTRHRVEALPEQWKVHDVQVNANSHKSYSEIVVKAEERIGFLYFFSGILASLGLNIEMCKCAGLGGQITNRFYVTPIVSPESVRRQIVERLK
ncbi:MAG: hypothetical protein O7E52_14500 [Candidatus Poribacteria bacterium]|nr:hypothetical protein [Candidatus Poribacteria bacterium]